MINNIKNNKLKIVEGKYILIQKDLNEIDSAMKNFDPNIILLLSINKALIQKNLTELNSLIKEFQNDEYLYEKIKMEIESDILALQEKGKTLTEEIIKNINNLKVEEEKIEKDNLKISNTIFLKIQCY